MNTGLLDVSKMRIKKSQGLLALLLILVIQSLIYFSLYRPRIDYADYGDAAILFSVAGLITLLIILFRRFIDKPSARFLLQIGWSMALIGVYHTALIQFVDMSYPNWEGLPDTIFQTFHDYLTAFLGVGLLFIFAGLYIWASDIRAREKRFQSVISAMPVGVAVIDLQGQVTLHNNMLLEILNLQNSLDQDDILWKILESHFDEIKSSTDEAFDKPVEFEIVLEDENKSKKYLAVAVVANKDNLNRTTSYIVVISDVTTRRSAEEERAQQQRVISLYASLLTHDVGNDLQAVLGYVEAASLTLAEDVEKTRTMLRSAEAAGNRMSNLIKTFRISSAPSHTEVVPMLRETAKQSEIADRGLHVQFDINPDVESERSPGGALLPTAFENILRNAAQHAGPNPEVNIRVFKEEPNLVIIISDNGPGISPELQDSLFHRSDPRRENGLGLYLTKQIITACGGTIELDRSAKAKGASYRINLPLIE